MKKLFAIGAMALLTAGGLTACTERGVEGEGVTEEGAGAIEDEGLYENEGVYESEGVIQDEGVSYDDDVGYDTNGGVADDGGVEMME